MKYIAILRGINVGGKRKILMADLKKLCAEIGFKNTQTYIQSGNIVFEYEEKANTTLLSKNLSEAIKETFGFDVPVITRTEAEWRNTCEKNPFLKGGAADIDKLHITFLGAESSEESLKNLETYDYAPDLFSVIGKDVFLFIEGKYHKTKLSNSFFEKKLNVPATTRNWKTIVKLLEIAGS